MSTIIEDGVGTGNKVKVSDNRIHTNSIVTSKIADVSHINGQSFILATGFISLTNTSIFNGIIYLKNTNTTHLHIEKIRTCGDGANGSGQVKIVTNPTTGTLITDERPAYINSINIGLNATFEGISYTGADSNTITNGNYLTQFIQRFAGHSIQEYDGSLILQNGQSMAISVKPSVATDFCVEIQCYFK